MKWPEHIKIMKRTVNYLFSLSVEYTLCLILSSFLSSALPYIPIWFSARLVDALFQGAPVRELALCATLAVGLTFLASLANAEISSRESLARWTMYQKETWYFSRKSMEMSYSCVEDPEVARLRQRIQMENQTGQNLYTVFSVLESFVYNITRICLSVSMTASLFFLDGVALWMKLALGASLFLAVVCGVLTTGKKEKLYEILMDECVELNLFDSKYTRYVDLYGSGKDIRLYDMAEGLLDLRTKLDKSLSGKAMRTVKREALYALAVIFLNHAVIFAAYTLLLYATLTGHATLGSIARHVSCVTLLLAAVSETASKVKTGLVNHKYLRRYFSWFDIPNPMYQGTLTVEKREDMEYDVEFRDVSFRYPNTEEYALRHVSLQFQIGEKLALVGKNGSGKTTFIKLLCRLYDPTEGEILLNGVNIKKYDYREYLSLFSVVFQDFSLFSFRLGQNVAASPECETGRAEKCLKQAGLGAHFGLERYLYKEYDKDGVEISGGEAQKIALARALYKGAPFLVLDEPTAALDPIAEYEVYSKFNKIAGGRTAVYISHRLASCRFCDKIAVFDAGRIVQTGGHEALLAQEGGRYHELWHAQAQYYK